MGCERVALVLYIRSPQGAFGGDSVDTVQYSPHTGMDLVYWYTEILCVILFQQHHTQTLILGGYDMVTIFCLRFGGDTIVLQAGA